jgi:hypothetical protein
VEAMVCLDIIDPIIVPSPPLRLGGDEPYDTRHHIDTVMVAHQPFYVGPTCFGPLIRAKEVPKGLKLLGSLKQYNRIDKPLYLDA